MKLNKSPKSLTEPVSRAWARRREFMEEVGKEIVEITQNRIEKTKKDPEGKRWAPWKPSTRKARQKDGSAGKGLLFRTGALRDSIEYKANSKNVTVFSQLPYAKFLQSGTKNMPARVFIGNGPQEERAIQRLWKDWINQ